MKYQEEKNDEKTILTERKAESWHFPDFVTPMDLAVTENDLVYDDEHSTGIGKEIIMEGVYVWYGKFYVHSDMPILVKSAGAHVQMNFSLQSVTTYYPKNPVRPFVRFRPQQHNLFLLPERDILVQWKPGEEVEVFSINLSTEFFFANLPVSHPLYSHFQKGIENILPAFMSTRNLPLSSKMISSLFEILHCASGDFRKSLFIKAKVIELMALQFEQYEQTEAPDITSLRTDSDTDKMHLARQILSENLDKAWSLKELAHLVGTNEFNLKKYFKEVFGKTVFGYLHDLRMETSMQMLQEPGSRISDISQKTGYRHSTHFTAAFKKYYGVLPNKIRVGMLNLAHFVDYLLGSAAEFFDGAYVFDMI